MNVCECGREHDPALRFYVTVRDGPDRWAALLGPFETHTEALGKVDLGRELARQADPRAAFYAYGTAGSRERLPVLFPTGRLS